MNDSRDGGLDERITEQVARVAPTAKLDGVSRARLRNRILAAADAVLDPAPAWWEMASAWARPLIPTAAAAGLLALLLGPVLAEPSADGVVLGPDTEAGEEWMLLADDPVLDGPDDVDGLLMAVLSTD